MEYLNFSYTIICSLSFLLLLIASNTSAVPLSRIIRDSLQLRENSQEGTSSDPKNFGLLTLENTRDIAPPSRRFPFAVNQRKAQPAFRQTVRGHHFLKRPSVFRSRRDTEESDQCVVSSDLPVVEASDLDTLLNATTFLGLNPSQPETPSIPDDQPDHCPSVHNPWWPGVEENLRSACPWRWDVKDMSATLGSDVYPRYVRQARCLCETCVTANIMGCSELRQPVTVFQKIGCKNGLAVMLKKTVDVTVGCFCQNPLPNSQPTETTTPSGLPPVDD